MDEQSPEQPHGALYGRLRWMQPGCLMWILISAVCICTVWIGPLLNLGSTGSELLDLIIIFAIGTGILWLIMTTTEYLTGDSGFEVLANQALVDRDFPGQDVVGKRFHLSDTVFATIIGVVANVRNVGPELPPRPEIYHPRAQTSRGASAFPIVVRVDGDPTQYIQQVTQAIQSVQRMAAVSQTRAMTDVIANAMGRPRFYLMLLGAFAVSALLLATAGLYGVMSYAVAQRTREIGIRTALGSTPGRTLSLVMSQGMKLVTGGLLMGILGGTALTFALGNLLGGLLYGVSRWDPATWSVAVIALALAAAAAILVPARRASLVQPLRAMRED